MNRDDARRLSEEPIDFTGATVERDRQPVRMSYSFRVREGQDEALAIWLEDEADRRGLNPSELLRQLVADARDAGTEGEDEVVVLRMSDLRRAVRLAARPAA